jgi:organic radical activating enzyme
LVARVEQPDGSFFVTPNPVGLSSAVNAVERLRSVRQRYAVHSCALTGGEPLLYPDFCLALTGALQQADLPVYLETAGHRPSALRRVSRFVSWVCMDLKLPSTLRTPVPLTLFADSAAWCETQLIVKVPVAEQITLEEFREGLQVLAKARRELALVIQPVTATGCVRPPSFGRLLDMLNVAARYFAEARLIPQCHRIMGAP